MGAETEEKGNAMAFDLQQTINDVISKVQTNPEILPKLLENPGIALEELLGVDLPDDQINGFVDGIKSQFGFSPDVQNILGEDGQLGIDDIGNIINALSGQGANQQ